MAKGPLVNTTNASASLMARIRVVKTDAQGLAAIANAPATRPAEMAPPPMLALPAPPTAPGFNAGMLSGEALRAIQRLNTGPSGTAPGVGGPDGGGAAAHTAPGNGTAGGSSACHGSTPIANAEDQRLQVEALKAIQALNANPG
eukprot:TRINITY_DN20922_c0_g1_i1.p2 TRINITY_DN20922_c0_g1~~TRINITY_DN20922_c0_g1_i1.p2  ORF type:complete len:144 (+),score=22.69 TRINITY_DN20922_c0_g1_i1:184-615(+)